MRHCIITAFENLLTGAGGMSAMLGSATTSGRVLNTSSSAQAAEFKGKWPSKVSRGLPLNGHIHSPTTQYLRTLFPESMEGMVLGTRDLKCWVLGASGHYINIGPEVRI